MEKPAGDDDDNDNDGKRGLPVAPWVSATPLVGVGLAVNMPNNNTAHQEEIVDNDFCADMTKFMCKLRPQQSSPQVEGCFE